ncbi:host specificity factor TipJ family phage tail protein [Atlantibacter sp. RC6]|uniref:host specificity factor TipJ family phage tail protein n=1 Tax=Atlantibacter sp. RC6 TaxID=2587036 RepID=UPI0016060CC1|nr:host specificity factor TipJ family phage tail protein [Atlantibacter sp. RC6]MBB3320893.1 hypothetical protein [Atlantibacter sp. RC6]
MATFEIQRLPGAPKQRGRLQPGQRMVDWLDTQKLHNNLQLKLNGRVLDDDFDLGYRFRPGDYLSVFDQPMNMGGIKDLVKLSAPWEAINPIRLTKKGMAAIQKTMMGDMKKTPSIATGESPNNDLTGQTNVARLYKGRPNIYGQVRAYPDLIQEALYEYRDDNKFITEWFEVGYGKYSISSVRYSESNLGALSGASYRIYQPGETIGTIDVGYQFDDIDSEEVPGLNESDDYPAQTATTTSPELVSLSGGLLTVKVGANVDNFSFFADLGLPHPVNFVINATKSGTPQNVTGTGDIVNSYDEFDANGDVFTAFIIGNIGGDAASLGPGDVVNQNLITMTDSTPLVIGPSVSPIESSQLWVHVMVQLGATSGTATYRIKFWKLDANSNQVPGSLEQYDYFFDNDYDVTARYFRTTHKFTPHAGSGIYAVTIERLDDSNDGNVVTLMAIHAVNVRYNVVYTDDTIVTVTLRGSNESNANREQKYNMLAQRNTISWSPATGIDYTLRPSRSFADAVLHEWVIVARQDPSRLDLHTLYAIAGSLPDAQLGYFDFTFSDAKQSLGERIQTICNAARVDINWIGDLLTFWRDEKASYPAAVFGRSNMFWDEFKMGYSMSLPNGYDGITLDYTNPQTNDKEYIWLAVSSAGVSEVTGATPNAMTISLSGCRNEFQARNRAYLEANRLINSRTSMTVKVFETTQVVRGAVVQCPDMYDNDQQTGYLKSRAGNVFETSERLNFTGDMWVVMTDSLGNFHGRYRAYPVDGNSSAFSATAEAFDLNIYDGRTVQTPSRYFLANSSDLNSTLWRVETSKPNGDDTQTLSLTEYSDEIYLND